MADPAQVNDQNLLPVQAYFAVDGTFQTFIGQGQPFYATPNPQQSGLHITLSTIDSSPIGATTPSTGAFSSATVLASPGSGYDVVNKNYLDYFATGLSWKQPVVAASTANLPLSGLGTIDTTVTLQAGDRVLVKNQGTASENGIYIADSGPWSRSPDANTWQELVSAICFVEEGDTQAGTAWYCTAQQGGTIGVTAVNWSNFSVAATYTAGTGLTLAGSQFSITSTGVAAATYGAAATVPVFAVNAQGQLTSVTNTSIAINGSQITSGTIGSSYLSGSYSGITGLGTLTNLTVSNPINGSVTGSSGTSTTATNLAGGAANSLPYQSASSTTAFLASGTGVLQDNGGLAWTTTPTLTGTNFSGIPTSAITGLGTMATQNANAVAITGGTATGLTNLGSDYLQLNTAAGASYAYGKLYWSSTGTLNVGLDGGSNLVMPVGEVLYTYGKASSAISVGQVIIKTGVVGASGVIEFGPATAGLTDGNSIVGIACEPISSGNFGRVVNHGVVRGFNLSAYNNNDTLWYDPAGGGALTATKPSAPNLKAEVGIVINNGSGGSGSMYVALFPGSQLGGTDQNVQITGTPANLSLLQYDSTAQYWKNVAASTVAVGTASNLAGGGAGYIPYQSGAGATSFVSAGTTGQVLTSNGTSAPTWSTPTSYATVTDDTTTNATRYPLFASVTTGNLTTEYVSSTKLKFNPSSGALTASQLIIAP
jgi:hypothetical protein